MILKNGKSLETNIFLSAADLRQISEYSNEKGAASLYVYSSPEETAREFENRISSSIDLIRHEAKIYNNSDLCLTVRDLDNLKGSLIDSFVTDKAKTYCAFLAPDFNKHIELPVKMKDKVTVSSEFYTLPLFSFLNQVERYAVLLFDRRQARLFNFFLGKLKEEESIFHDYVLPNFNATSGSWKGLGEQHLANKIKDTFHRHLKEISDHVFNHFNRLEFDKLILGAKNGELIAIKGHLHSYLLRNLACEFNADVNNPLMEIQKQVQLATERCRQEQEEQKIKYLINNFAHRNAILGTNLVADGLMSGSLRELVIDPDYHAEGFYCPERHFLTSSAVPENKCVYCGKPLLRTKFLENEITEEAYLQGAEIYNILLAKDNFNEYGVGGTLRF